MSGNDKEDDTSNPWRSHPDSHAVNDWFLYGPRDSRIAELVCDLVIYQRMRITDVEELMVETLERKRGEF